MMKRKRNQITASGIVACTCLLAACTAQIEIETVDAVEHLVIYGTVTNELKRQRIDITRSAPYFSDTAPGGVSGAEVRVTASTGEVYLFSEELQSPGVYLSDAAFAGFSGESYQLDVAVDWNNDGTPDCFTASERMPLPLLGERIDLKWSRMKDYVDVLAWCELPREQENYICLKVRINNRMVTDSLDQYTFFDESYINSKTLEGVEIYSLSQKDENLTLAAGDELTLIALSLTKEFYDFSLNGKKEVRPSPPIMVGPPANMPTNLMRTAGAVVPLAGYFSACATDSVSVSVTEEFINK